MFKSIILLVIAVIPIMSLLKYVFYKDKIEKEPAALLFKLFMSGVFSAAIVLIISRFLTSKISIDNSFYNSFIEIALIEEVCKWICIYIITWKNKEFDYKFDAIVYSIFVSLGFAFVENIAYSFNYGIMFSLLRAVISIPGHTFFGTYMGYYLGHAKMCCTKCDYKNGFVNGLYSILVPTLLHGIYDYCLIGENDGLYILFIIYIVFLYILSFKTINVASSSDMALKTKQ